MMFDEEAAKALHAAVRRKGYRGKRNELMDELRAQSYGAEVRLFISYALSVTLQHYPEARTLVTDLCQQAQKRFARITTNTYDISSTADIVFSHGKRLQRKRGQPLRMDCFAVSAHVREGKAEVRIQVYIDNELRRDISRYFTQTSAEGCTQ